MRQRCRKVSSNGTIGSPVRRWGGTRAFSMCWSRASVICLRSLYVICLYCYLILSCKSICFVCWECAYCNSFDVFIYKTISLYKSMTNLCKSFRQDIVNHILNLIILICPFLQTVQMFRQLKQFKRTWYGKPNRVGIRCPEGVPTTASIIIRPESAQDADMKASRLLQGKPPKSSTTFRLFLLHLRGVKVDKPAEVTEQPLRLVFVYKQPGLGH